MIIMFEIIPPFRWKMKIDKCGPMTRVIWGYFSIAYFHKCGINDLRNAFIEDFKDYYTSGRG